MVPPNQLMAEGLVSKATHCSNNFLKCELSSFFLITWTPIAIATTVANSISGSWSSIENDTSSDTNSSSESDNSLSDGDSITDTGSATVISSGNTIMGTLNSTQISNDTDSGSGSETDSGTSDSTSLNGTNLATVVSISNSLTGNIVVTDTDSSTVTTTDTGTDARGSFTQTATTTTSNTASDNGNSLTGVDDPTDNTTITTNLQRSGGNGTINYSRTETDTSTATTTGTNNDITGSLSQTIGNNTTASFTENGTYTTTGTSYVLSETDTSSTTATQTGNIETGALTQSMFSRVRILNMMLGTQHRFGIECYVRSFQGQNIIGDLWLWANGLRIGDEISGVDLPLILDQLAGPLRLQGSRHDVFFDRLTKENVVEFFLKLIFSEEEVNNEVATIGFFFRRNLVISAPDLEGFDSVFLLLLGRSDGRDRLIWKYKGTKEVHEMLLDPGEYDECVLSCFDWLEKQTGYRSQQRTWLGLEEPQRMELRQAILTRRPQLGEPGLRESLDQATIEELNRKKL